jgi:hypothetical protein
MMARGLQEIGVGERRVSAEFSAKCRIALRQPFANNLSMARMDIIGARVTPELKARFRALAEHEQLSESSLLTRVIEAMLLRPTDAAAVVSMSERRPLSRRFSVRVTPDDLVLLDARARARGMRAATYAAVLLRAHLRSLAPLPKDELLALKQSVSELGAIGRNLNQLARIANQGNRVAGPTREDLRALIKVCEGLRDHVKDLIRANITSWEQGHAETND